MFRRHLSMYSATVKFSPAKNCFVQVPSPWLKGNDTNICKILHEDNKETVVSCLAADLSYIENPQVLINAKFAEKLGLKEKDKICLQMLFPNIPSANQLTLEPLTCDDWEILELNAKTIENNLIHQIRVVSLNQIFPVWVNNSSCFVQVVETCDSTQTVMLVESSQVSVIPKGRPESKSTPESVKKKTPSHLQFQHLRHNRRKSASSTDRGLDTSDCSSQDSKSTVQLAFSYFSSFLNGVSDEKHSSLNESYEDFAPMNLDLTLRVLPYTRSKITLPLVVQATTVFISASTYVECYGSNDVPPCFVAILQKVPSPQTCKAKNVPSSQRDKETKETNTKNSSKISVGSKESKSSENSTLWGVFKDNRGMESSRVWSGSKESKSMESSADEEKQVPFDSVCVTVMVVHSAEEDEFNLPPSLFFHENVIVVPRELKRCLSLEVASLVRLKGIQTRPTPLNSLVLHPVTSLTSSATTEIILTNFQKWAFGGNATVTSFVISDGTLLHLKLFGQKHDFFISINENSNQTLNNSSTSSFSTTSSRSTDSDKQFSPKYGYLHSDNINDVTIIVGNAMCITILGDRPYLQKYDGIYQDIPAVQLNALGGVKDLALQALENLEFWLKLRPAAYITNHPFSFSGGMLLCGPKGVGKSALAKALCKNLSRSYVHVKIIECLPYKGRRVDIIAKKWEEILVEASLSQPSVILFEDLDKIASCSASHEQEIGPDGVYFFNISQTFIHFMKKISSCSSKIAVIVTAQSTHSLHPSLVSTRGRHIFQSIIEIQPPNTKQRKDILKSSVNLKEHISRKTIDNVDWTKVASKTEGFVAEDLVSLIDRATHAAWVREANSSPVSEIILMSEDFQMALEGYVPSSLRGIPLQVHDHRTWNDVGGLKDVKKTIQQIILWPVKYKQIFKSYSLKPQTNILLYGAPGTGKTLLAGVIANECGFNFISIKGPELLSKYIGASEQAVRDLFKRASAARPCILFFDEFDSIAPRRGHDSTGVTDRVVNQLLTQLDGVESLEGVHVLAASSRPELIDPALLRPGRLDKCLFCPLPDQSERYEILLCLSSKLLASADIDFLHIASKTEHFSGADLQALLYSANIAALHDAQKSTRRRYSTGSHDISYINASGKILYMPKIQDGLNVPTYEDGKKIIQEIDVIKDNFCGVTRRARSRGVPSIIICVNQQHLLATLEDMKPSVSPSERMRYEAVFRNFQNGAMTEPTSSLAEGLKRVTLA